MLQGALTAVDEAHRDVEFVNVELAAISDIGEVPVDDDSRCQCCTRFN